MQKRILLINAPHTYNTVKRDPGDFPLGLGYLGAVLLKEGHLVKVLDLQTEEKSEGEVFNFIREYNPDLIGISALSTQFKHVEEMAKKIKSSRNTPIVLGGALATFNPELVLKHTPVDICVIGEGEETLVDLVKNLDNLSQVRGISYKNRGEIRTNEPREYIQNLDTIPFPAWDLFDIEKYATQPKFFEGYGKRSMQVITSRGCPFNCKYCSKTFKRTRLRSIDSIIQEILVLKNKYNIEVIHFLDELVITSKKRAEELCGKIQPLKIKWQCQGRVNNVDLDILKKMKKAGCARIGYGIETGSQRILDNMNKNATVAMAEEALKNTRKAGLVPIIQMMFGYPGEDEESIRETIEFCKRNHIHPLNTFSITTAIPGAKLYDECLEKKIITDERKYLNKLEGTQTIVLNFTKWTDSELLRIKNEAEETILKNYIHYRKTHPLVFLSDYRHKLKRFYRYAKYKGVKKAVRDVFRYVKTKPSWIFNAEYR